jgi:hypothetical protein
MTSGLTEKEKAKNVSHRASPGQLRPRSSRAGHAGLASLEQHPRPAAAFQRSRPPRALVALTPPPCPIGSRPAWAGQIQPAKVMRGAPGTGA